MSVVTDIIITCGLAEEDGEDVFPAIDHINRYLESEERGTLTHLNPYAGGFKAWQVDVFGGAFNWLDMDGFASAVASAPWERPEEVSILIQTEEDEIMREVLLVEGPGYNRAAEELRAALRKRRLEKK